MTQALYKKLYHNRVIEILYCLNNLRVCHYTVADAKGRRMNTYSHFLVDVIL